MPSELAGKRIVDMGMSVCRVIGLVVGNFLYQALVAHPKWGVAVERSIFQMGAVTTVLWGTARRFDTAKEAVEWLKK